MKTITNFETNVSVAVTGSAQSMADKLNISRSSVNRILKGDTACGFELVEDITNALNVAEPVVEEAETAVVEKKEDKPSSKADKARKVFGEMYGVEGNTPKLIKEKMIKEAGLSKAGASTYYYNMKKKADA